MSALTKRTCAVLFAGVGGFAGGAYGIQPRREDPGSSPGPLEITRTALCTSRLAELMAAFNTAALILFSASSREHRPAVGGLVGLPGRSNTTEAAWLTGVIFHFHDENAAQLDETVQEVLETDAQLHYRYEDISAPR